MDDREARERVARVEALLERGRGAARPGAPATRRTEVVGALLDLYGEGLAPDRRARAATARRRSPSDELRLAPAAAARPAPGAARGARARGARGGAAVPRVPRRRRRAARRSRTASSRLRLEGSCNGCPSSAVTLEARDRGARSARRRPDVERDRGRGRGAEPAGPALIQLEPPLATAEPWATPARCPAAAAAVLRRSPASRAVLRGRRHAYAYRPAARLRRSLAARADGASSVPGCGHATTSARGRCSTRRAPPRAGAAAGRRRGSKVALGATARRATLAARRLAQRRRERVEAERCELCGEPIPPSTGTCST